MAATIKITSVFRYEEGVYKADATMADEAGEVSLGVRVRANSIAEAEQAALARVRAVAAAVAAGE